MMDTANKFLVGVRGDKIAMLDPPRGEMSKDDALLLAAWLVTLADDEKPYKFLNLIAAIQGA